MKIFTIILAAWGAIVSTIALGWNIRNSMHDRGRLKIAGELRKISRKQLERSEKEIYQIILNQIAPEEKAVSRLFVYVYNIGKRPIVISKIEITFDKNKSQEIKIDGKVYKKGSMILISEYPKKIDAGDFELFDYSFRVIDESFTGIRLTTADDKVYTMPKGNVERLIRISLSEMEHNTNNIEKNENSNK